MSGELPWFRLYHELAMDPVIRLLSFDDQRHYVWVLCMKNRGDLDKDYPTPEVRARAIAGVLGVSLSSADEIRRRLLEVGLIDHDWHPAKWDQRQMPSDNSTQRVREHRAREREKRARDKAQNRPLDAQVPPAGPADPTAGGETGVKRYSNGLDTELDTETPHSPPVGGPDLDREPEGGAERRGEGRGTRIPDDFPLTPARRQISAQLCQNPDRTFAKFQAHFRSMGGARARRLDWDAAWQEWCLWEADRRPRNGPPSGPAAVPESPADREAKLLERLADRERSDRAIAAGLCRQAGLPVHDQETAADLDRRLGEHRLGLAAARASA